MTTRMKKSVSLLLATTVLLIPVKPSRADTPAAVVGGLELVVAGAAVVGAAAAVIQAGVALFGSGGDKGGDKGGGKDDSGTTTTTTTTTTTDENGNTTTTTTTTTTSKLTTGGLTPGKWFAFEELQRLPSTAGDVGMAFDRIDNQADVKRTAATTRKVTYTIVRRTFVEISRTARGPKALTLPIALRLKQLRLTTKEIPATQGQSSFEVQVNAEGRSLYHFSASVAQGQKPTFTKDIKYSSTKEENSVLEINDLSKDISFTLPPRKAKLRLELVVTTQGVGQRV
ncbi:hypothetical protein [Armatimonas rosea]|uniref:Uncharacterized protein n=1 Tax=Armatimonas rosea TaxID=685828 RepID=A0A7W9SS71_ARMRO|nr:hypothetical protein [Armatimonas rosea]MBB6051103.1 hypothetical protein [Armatimonas rosea]